MANNTGFIKATKPVSVCAASRFPPPCYVMSELSLAVFRETAPYSHAFHPHFLPRLQWTNMKRAAGILFRNKKEESLLGPLALSALPSCRGQSERGRRERSTAGRGPERRTEAATLTQSWDSDLLSKLGPSLPPSFNPTKEFLLEKKKIVRP